MSYDFLSTSPRTAWSPLPWWGYVVVALALTHVTIASRHDLPAPRAGAPRARPASGRQPLLPLLALAHDRHGHQGVGRDPPQAPRQVSRPPDDPHSPQTRGISTVLWQGAELYRAEAKNQETLEKYGHGTPDDWIERNVYTRYSWQGVGLMLRRQPRAVRRRSASTIWAVQMAVDPDHRRRHHQRHRPLLGLPQLRVRRRVAPTSCRGAS